MRNEKAIDGVGVRQHALKAAERHGSADWMQEIEQSADAVSRHQVLGLGDILRGDVALTLKTKNGDEVKVSLKVAGLLMAAVITFCGWAVYMVRSNARLEEKVQNMADNQRAYESRQDSAQREYQTQIITAMATTDAYIAHQTNRMQKVESLMPKWAQAELNEWDVAHPAPQRIKPENFRFNTTPNEQNEEASRNHVRSSLQDDTLFGRRASGDPNIFNQEPRRID